MKYLRSIVAGLALTVSGAANADTVPRLTGPLDPGNTLQTFNQVIDSINTARSAGPVGTCGGDLSGTFPSCDVVGGTHLTGALGAVTLGSATGLPISTGVSGLGTGIATFLATPTSANLATAVTNETGSGALVFGTSPTLTTPVLSGSVTGTYTLAGTPTITAPALSGTVTGTYTLGGTPTITAPTISGVVTGATSYNGVVINGTNTTTGTISIGNGVPTGLGSESICIGPVACQANNGQGAITVVGQSGFLSNTAAGGLTGFGNDIGKFYTGSQAMTLVGSGAWKNGVGGGNSVVIGDGAAINWTTNAGTANSNTIVGGNNTFAGTAGNGQLNGNDVFGANIATSASVGGNKNIFIGANMLNTTFRNGSNNIVICTNASATCDTAASNTSNTINLDSVLTWTGINVIATSVPTIHGLPVFPDVPTGTAANFACFTSGGALIKQGTACA